MNIKEQIDALRNDSQNTLQKLADSYNKDTDDIFKNFDLEIKTLCEQAGKKVCDQCRGYGCSMRLDASYMRKFNLREWDGCKKCGGTSNVKGNGYV